MRNFEISDIKAYQGPNHLLGRPALRFTLHHRSPGELPPAMAAGVAEKLPALKGKLPADTGGAFAAALVQVMKMDMDLFVNQSRADKTPEGYAVAVEYLDEDSARDSARMVSDWFHCLEDGHKFDFDGEFKKLQADFDKTLYGGPTLYSLIEAALKRGIPVHYIF